MCVSGVDCCRKSDLTLRTLHCPPLFDSPTSQGHNEMLFPLPIWRRSSLTLLVGRVRWRELFCSKRYCPSEALRHPDSRTLTKRGDLSEISE